MLQIEFAVQLSGDDGVNQIKKCLEGFGNVEIDPNLGRVIVHTNAPWSDIQNKIEDTGRRAVLTGFGGRYNSFINIHMYVL